MKAWPLSENLQWICVSHQNSQFSPQLFETFGQFVDCCLQSLSIIDSSRGIVCRVLELVIKPEQIEQNEENMQAQRTPKYSVDAFSLKMEPMSPEDAQILQSVWASGIAANNEQYFIDPYGFGYNSESQPSLIRFCLEHGLWDKLLKQYPFIEPVLQDLDRKAAIDGIEQFYQDIMRMSAYGIAEGRPLTPDSPYYEKNLFGSELLIALQKNPCPKACIAMLLINASFDRHLQDSLPYLLAQFNWFVPGGSEIINDHEIVVGGHFETFGNAWYRWDGESFFLLGQRLADMPDKDLMERLNSVTTNSQQFVDWEYNYYQSHEMLVSPDFPPSPDIPKTLLSGYEFKSYELDIKKLIKIAKLETTRQKLSELQTTQGTIVLTDLLKAKFTAPEREDVRRLLDRVLDKKTTYFCFLSDQQQVELLPDHAFENWIRHSAASGGYDSLSGDIAWAVLFSRNSKKAMDLFEELYSSYLTEKQLPQIIWYGYEHYLSCPFERVTAFLTEHESDLMQNFGHIHGDKLQLRLHPEDELQILNQAMQSQSWLETKERKFFALTEFLFGMKFVSQDISASVIRELFTDDIGSNLAQLLCYLFTDEQNY